MGKDDPDDFKPSGLKRHSEWSHRWSRGQLCLGAVRWEGNGEGFSEEGTFSWRAHKCMHGNGKKWILSCITNRRKTYWQNNHLLCGWLGSWTVPAGFHSLSISSIDIGNIYFYWMNFDNLCLLRNSFYLSCLIYWQNIVHLFLHFV